MAIPLEDSVEDILAKAQAGLGLSPTELAERTGLDRDRLKACRRGEANTDALSKLAEVLGLAGDRLLALARGAWQPAAIELPGLWQSTTSYPPSGAAEMTVNAYLVYDAVGGHGAIFDTGGDAKPLVAKAREEKLTVRHLFVTHCHRDHVADLGTLQRAFPEAITYASTTAFSGPGKLLGEGDELEIGQLRVRVRATPGHANDALSYVIAGLERPVAIVGDAIFAGSMGGAAGSWDLARRMIWEKLLTLPPETVLCPGHGPLTSVGEELAHNPFFSAAGR